MTETERQFKFYLRDQLQHYSIIACLWVGVLGSLTGLIAVVLELH